MKKHHRLILCILLLIIPCLSLAAGDFGIILDQSGSYSGISGGDSSDNITEYTGSLIPRFSALIGERGDIYLSAGLNMEYTNEEWHFVPELLRTEFNWLSDNAAFTAGRMHYSDPLGFIAQGLFDGAQVSFNTAYGTFSAGAWYTGFLYKKRAEIAMTGAEMENYNADLDYGDFVDTYFASRRLLSALDWEHPSLVGGFVRAKLSLMGQFDLNDEDYKLHSQYVTGKLSLPAGAFLFDIGGSFGLFHATGEDAEPAFAAEAGVAYTLPTSFPSRLSFLGRYSSGVADNGSYVAFIPVTTQPHGSVIEAKITGITMLSLDYIARLHRTVAISIASSYFIRSDLGTYTAYPVYLGSDTDKGYFLGNEFFARLFWNPVSDLSFNLGGGVFLPSMGNVASSADPMWRVELNLVLSLY